MGKDASQRQRTSCLHMTTSSTKSVALQNSNIHDPIFALASVKAFASSERQPRLTPHDVELETL